MKTEQLFIFPCLLWFSGRSYTNLGTYMDFIFASILFPLITITKNFHSQMTQDTNSKILKIPIGTLAYIAFSASKCHIRLMHPAGLFSLTRITSSILSFFIALGLILEVPLLWLCDPWHCYSNSPSHLFFRNWVIMFNCGVKRPTVDHLPEWTTFIDILGFFQLLSITIHIL